MLSKAPASVFLGCFLLLTSQLQGSKAIPDLSVCNLRERPDAWNGKAVQTSGWIYTNIEHFGLEEQSCGVELIWPKNREKDKSAQVKKFAKLLKAAKKNPFETEGKLFVILQGKFETAFVRKDGQLVLDHGSGSTANTLTIQKIVCSVLAPASTTSKAQASQQCQQ